MKILVTSDVHINSWNQFSEIDKYGRPDRLLKYLSLAEDIKELYIKEKCNAIIIAGDLTENSLQPPHVLDVIGTFLRTLAKVAPVHIIHGNHDLSTKASSNDRVHSLLNEICKDITNVFYYSEPTFVQLGANNKPEIVAVFCPWTEDNLIPEDTDGVDLFVGHGLVSGAENQDGFIFQSGFSSSELIEKFRVSIIGDIHNGKVISKDTINNRKVLIPGVPIQANWKDQENCGLWIIDIESKGVGSDIKFFPIHELHPNFYHRFTFNQKVESSELVHVRAKLKISSKPSSTKTINIDRTLPNLYSICEKIIDEEKVDNLTEIKEKLKSIFDSTEVPNDKVISNTTLEELEVENFGSINAFKLNFNEFPSSCVIVGHNGSGKSSVPEAIYWGITGATTKGVQISDVVNRLKPKDTTECKVILTLNINGKKYKITRTRGKASGLELEMTDGSVYKKGSIKDTQDFIYSLLGLTDWQILMFCYFSTQKTRLFSDLGDSDKNNIMSQIAGLDYIDKLREVAKEKKEESHTEEVKISSMTNSLSYQYESLQQRMFQEKDKEKESSNDNLERKVLEINNDISTEKGVLTSLNKEYVEFSKSVNLTEIDSRIGEICELTSLLSKQLTKAENRVKTLETSLLQDKKFLQSVLSGVCPTCNQDLKNNELEVEKKENIKNILEELKEFKEKRIISNLVKEIEDLHAEISNLSNLKEKNAKLTRDLKEAKANLERSLNVRKTLEELKTQVSKESESKLDLIVSQIKENEDERNKLNGLLVSCRENEKQWKYIETSLLKKKGSLIKLLNEQSAISIQNSIDQLLVNEKIDIKISNDLSVSGKFINNQWTPYDNLSSGQKRVTDIVLMVALNNLFSNVYHLENGVLGLAIYDEILSFLDPEYIEIAKNIVDKSICKKMLVITHDNSLINMYDSRIQVKMGKHGSEYKTSWRNLDD